MTPADRAMELLCLLSTEPAPIDLLAGDLKLSTRTVAHLVGVLRDRGFLVELRTHLARTAEPYFVSVVIPAVAWAECRGAAQRYWNLIHS